MIAYCAFENCETLRQIVIHKSVFHVERAAFSGCVNLESIIVDQNNPIYHSKDNCLIQTDANVLVAGCKTSVIPSETCIIGPYAFYNCIGLTNIETPECDKYYPCNFSIALFFEGICDIILYVSAAK